MFWPGEWTAFVEAPSTAAGLRSWIRFVPCLAYTSEPVLLATIYGPGADAVDESTALGSVLGALAALLPDSAGATVTWSAVKAWSDDPFALGAFSYYTGTEKAGRGWREGSRSEFPDVSTCAPALSPCI